MIQVMQSIELAATKRDSTEYFHRQDCLFHVSERYSAGYRPAAKAAFSTHWCCRTDGLKILLG